MRVPPPGLLKLDRKQLLRDVRDRLVDRLPRYGSGPDDPTDPGWILLEEAAWLAEVLSEQLDRYPFAVVQQLLHILGGHLRPALPSLGALVVAVNTEGVMRTEADLPAPWRFFTPQNERKETVEFVAAEPEVSLWKGRVVSVCELREGELFRSGRRGEDKGLGAQIAWRHAPARSAVFDRELVRYTAMTPNPEDLAKSMSGALGRLGERNLGWLRLSVERSSSEQVTLVAEVDPAGAFARTAPGGIWTGGDLPGDWGTLDESTWTPPVTISDHPLLPPRMRGQKPMPSPEEGRILIPDVPVDFPVAKLLTRRASPVPGTVVEAIWRTVAAQDTKLVGIKPSIKRIFKPADPKEPEEPTWLPGALELGLYARLAGGAFAGSGPRTVAHVNLSTLRAEPGTARLALLLADASFERPPQIEVWGMDATGTPGQHALKHRVAWYLPAPPPAGTRGLAGILAIDVPIQPELTDLLLACAGAPHGVLLNAVMVANLPAVRDGRRWTIQRNVPESVNLLFEDVVGPDVVELLLEQPIPEVTAAVLRRMPLCWLGAEGQKPVMDYTGVQLDPSEGKVTFNAPDGQGNVRPLRPGTRMRLDWYRRTDGEAGDVGPGAISLVEQPPETTPSIAKVTNPLGTFFGADRESPEAAIDRMAVPSGGLPVLPTDWERLVRQALGNRAQGWMVRVWTYTERSLLTTATWPLEPGERDLGAPDDPESRRFTRALGTAGPDQLLVVVGPPDKVLSEPELDWARQVIVRQVRLLAARIPTIRGAIVTRFWPLTLASAEADGGDAGEELVGLVAPDEALALPTFSVGELSGTLRDPQGRAAPIPRVELLLNAAVVRRSAGEAG